jgi:hypothetical protein
MGDSNGKSVWMWICGILVSILGAGAIGVFTGSYFSRASDELLLKTVRVERIDYMNDWYDKRIEPKLINLENSNRLQIQSLEILSKKIDTLINRP